MDSISRIQQADEKRWEYDNTVMEINNNINKYSIAINGLQQSLGMNNQISGLDLAKQASKSAQTWNNISTVASTAAATDTLIPIFIKSSIGVITSDCVTKSPKLYVPTRARIIAKS